MSETARRRTDFSRPFYMPRHVVPTWLDAFAKQYWKKVRPTLDLQTNQEDTFAVLAQTYSHYRQATDLRDRTKYLDYFLKLAKEFGLTPRTNKIKPKETPNSLDQFLSGDNDG